MKNFICGGGVAGLSLCHALDCTLVSRQIGGWLQTKEHLMETGPRTLRPHPATLNLIYSLDLSDQIVKIKKSSPAAKNRFILQKNNSLLNASSILSSSLTNPFSRHLIWSLLKEPFQQSISAAIKDESIHDFVSRRFGSRVSDELVSAIINGIYASPLSELSAKSCLTTLVRYERQYGSIILGALLDGVFNANSGNSEHVFTSKAAEDWCKMIQKDTAVYAFKNGIQTLVNRLQSKLGSKIINGNVIAISKNHVDYQDAGNGQIVRIEADKIICAIPPCQAHPLFKDSEPKTSKLLEQIKSINIGVVNLVYPAKFKPPPGFGYLVPSTLGKEYFGVVFDSCLVDTGVTRLTVMMPPKTHSEMHSVALQAVQNTLSFPSSECIHSLVSLHVGAIPQYKPGHADLINEIREGSQVEFIGAGFDGVAINDIVHHSNLLARKLK